MNKKTVAFTKPSGAKPIAASGDTWVQSRTGETDEAVKRLQVEIPMSLHSRVKAGAVKRGHRTMSDMVRAWLEKEFPPE